MTVISDNPTAFFVVDTFTALASAYVAFRFLRSWRAIGSGFLLTIGLGFALLGLADLAIVTSERATIGTGFADAARFWGRMAAFSVLALSYLAAKREGRRLLVALAAGIAAVAVGVVLAALLLAPPFLAFPRGSDAEAFVFAVNSLLATATAILSSAAFLRRPEPALLPVPVGFLLLALSQYTWLLNELGTSTAAIMFGYGWRVAGVAMFVTAVHSKARHRGET